MNSARRTIIIGGGFYGCCLAIFFRDAGDEVVLLEAESQLLTRASYNNQARVHQGYHYPRSILTGKSCVTSFPLFAEVFPDRGRQRFHQAVCHCAGQQPGHGRAVFRILPARRRTDSAKRRPASRTLFDRDLIEEVFQVQEYAFDAARLRELMQAAFGRRRRSNAFRLHGDVGRTAGGSGQLQVRLGKRPNARGRPGFQLHFADINSLLHRSGLPILDFRHELAEIALIRPPSEIAGLGITVMDGPFFSTMPFPAENLHSLTHVRYTPHKAWQARDQLLRSS